MSDAVVGARYVQPGTLRPRWTSLREWGIRPKLVVVLTIPTLAALALSGLNLQAALKTISDYGHIYELSSSLGRQVTTVTGALQDERDLSSGLVTRGVNSDPSLTSQRQVVDRAVANLRTTAGRIDTSYDPGIQRKVAAALSGLSGLSALRGSSAIGAEAATTLVRGYSAIVATLLQINGDLHLGNGDGGFVEHVEAMADVSRAAEMASQQRALLYIALQAGSFRGTLYRDLIAARTQQDAALSAFRSRGGSDTMGDQEMYGHMVTGPGVDLSDAALRRAINSGSTAGVGLTARQWFTLKSAEITQINRLAGHQLDEVASRARQLRGLAQRRAVSSAVIIGLILLFVMIATLVVARSMIGPLQRLRSAALDVADRGLPETVRRLHEGDMRGLEDFEAGVRPVDVVARDELGQVARAFDAVHAQAVRLAGEQALMRANMSSMFVNLSRRSQTLVERQLRVLDQLESSERDPDQLASLYTLDLLATRMRRNDENLLVLAGAEAGRRWTHPVPILDVVRAGVAEVEQYPRVQTHVQPGFDIASAAVSDVVHLLAELLENAATFSAPETPVEIRSRSLGASGELMIDVEDQGIGMTEEQMAEANERLAAPPAFDVSASRMMGLYVVARLAQRHDIKVRLRLAPSGGVTALVQIPTRIALPAAGAGASTAAETTRSHSAELAETLPAYIPSAPDRLKVAPAPPAPSPPIRAAPPEPPRLERLPIFDTVQSEWFVRPDRDSFATVGAVQAQPAAAAATVKGWSSPGDEGWRAAQVVTAPVAAGVTDAGLPIRVRGSNLVPGSAAGTGAPAPPVVPAHPAHAAQGLSSYQRGIARGRGLDDNSASTGRRPADAEQQEARP